MSTMAENVYNQQSYSTPVAHQAPVVYQQSYQAPTVHQQSPATRGLSKHTSELPDGNNVVPLRSDTIRLVQNGCSFHGLRSEDPNQHHKDFLKIIDSLDLNVENRERMCLRLFHFSLRDQASNWLERLLAGSISTWEDLTTHFLAQFFPPGRTAKLWNDILMFQKHQGIEVLKATRLSIRTLWNLVKLNALEPIELVRSMKEELTGWETKAKVIVEKPRSQPIRYYLKHKINEKLIEGVVDTHKYNDSLLAIHLGMLKYVNALIDQGSDVNVIPISIYNRLTNEKPVWTDIRLSLASHSYIYPLGIAEDVLIDIAGYVYHVDFNILDIEEDKNKPFILGTPFLTTAKAKI
nr:zinc finger, CCHC-type [Tanacetum cinerariifolium]